MIVFFCEFSQKYLIEFADAVGKRTTTLDSSSDRTRAYSNCKPKESTSGQAGFEILYIGSSRPESSLKKL